MIPLYHLLKIKFPDINILPIGGDVQLGDHGNGEIVILQWNYDSAPQPSQDEIDQWMIDAEIGQQYTYIQNRVTNATLYKQLDEIDVKSIRALRTNDVRRLAQLEEQAASLRAQLLPVA